MVQFGPIDIHAVQYEVAETLNVFCFQIYIAPTLHCENVLDDFVDAF